MGFCSLKYCSFSLQVNNLNLRNVLEHGSEQQVQYQLTFTTIHGSVFIPDDWLSGLTQADS